jgi:23S rRNA (guanosine2251-2'-O)-methyltransferase
MAVFSEDGGVLYWHRPSAERDHARPGCVMLSIKRKCVEVHIGTMTPAHPKINNIINPKVRRMIFYGINPIMEALRAQHPLQHIYVVDRKSSPAITKILNLAKREGVLIRRVPDMRGITKSPDHQGVCAECDDLGTTTLPLQPIDADRIVMLDGIEDPHNFGASLRVCEGMGVRDVIYHKGNSSGITPAAVKVSTGALFHLNLYHSNLNSAIKKLKYDGVAIVVLDGGGDTTIYDWEPTQPYCLVIGSEGKGVRFAIQRQADLVLRIPMRGNLNSLNVSCALTAALAVTGGGRQQPLDRGQSA